MVVEAGLGPEAVGGVTPKILRLRRRYRHADPAGTFPGTDRRSDYRRRQSVQLSVQARLKHDEVRVGWTRGGKRAPSPTQPGSTPVAHL
jgi:hypothetical protein